MVDLPRRPHTRRADRTHVSLIIIWITPTRDNPGQSRRGTTPHSDQPHACTCHPHKVSSQRRPKRSQPGYFSSMRAASRLVIGILRGISRVDMGALRTQKWSSTPATDLWKSMSASTSIMDENLRRVSGCVHRDVLAARKTRLQSGWAALSGWETSRQEMCRGIWQSRHPLRPSCQPIGLGLFGSR